MKHTLAIIAMTVTVGVTGWTVTTIAPSAVAESVAVEAITNNRTLTFAIAKMTCAMCPVTVRKAMQQVEGVESVDVNYKNKTATVAFDPIKTTPRKIAEASTNAGYPAQPIGG